jgi:beta-lactamase class A
LNLPFNAGALLRSALLLVIAAYVLMVSAAAQTPANSATPAGTQSELLWKKLEANVDQIDADLDGTVGVAIMDLTDGRVLLRNADHVFATASSIKVAVLAELYHQQQQSAEGVSSKAKLTDLYTMDTKDLVDDSAIMAGLTPGVSRVTNRDLATFMVAVSDNSATNVLIDRLGMQNVNALLASLGIQQTKLQRKMMDVKAAQEGRENIASPRELMGLFAALYQKKVLNKELTGDFFKLLGTHKESSIPRYLPEGVVCANKPGELAGVRNDVGIVFAQNRPFVIVVMTAYLNHELDGAEAISKISAAAYDYFDRVGRSSPYGRVVSEHNSR